MNPGATEVCDDADVDEDCDGAADDADVSVDTSGASVWYIDGDDDGYGDADDGGTLYCDDPSNTLLSWLSDNTDCDDGDDDINPGATEVCDEDDVDEDCSGYADDDDSGVDSASQTAWYVDADEDGFGDEDDGGVAYCDDPSSGGTVYLEDNTDCDDSTDEVNPGATEVCDADDVDEDCSGWADDDDPGVDSSSQTEWYWDSDGDTYGDPDELYATQCEDPSTSADDFVTDTQDCDDEDDAINPDGIEDCDDGADNDCDGNIDEACQGTADATSVVEGESSGDYFGWRIATGDFNGDGQADVLNQSQNAGTGGKVYVSFGPVSSGSIGASSADVTYTTSNSDAYLGFGIGATPDMDGDGIDDVLATALYEDQVYLLTGVMSGGGDAETVAHATFEGASFLGRNIGPLGDADGDGNIDVLLGAHSDSEAYLFYGPVSGTYDASSADAVLVGTGSGNDFGISTSLEHDYDGDGVSDAVVTAYDKDKAYLFYGALSGSIDAEDADVILSGDSGDDFGSSLATGDFDGDGYNDMAIGANDEDSGGSDAGMIYVFAGPITTGGISDAISTIGGQSGGDYLGSFYAEIEAVDFNEDGMDDLLLADRYSDDGATQAGAISLFMGPVSGDMESDEAEIRIVHDGSYDYFGSGLDAADVDGDGLIDLIGGAYATSSGNVYTFFGSDL